MNPQDVCVTLSDMRTEEVSAALGTGPVPSVQDLFPEAGSDAFLRDNIEDLSALLTDMSLIEHKLIGSLETNAFLGALQKAVEAQKRSRAQNWADVYSQKSRISSGGGALQIQLRGIGAKVDDEWLTKILAVSPIGDSENVI